MDANGLRFWMLAKAKHWQLVGDPPGVQYDSECLRLRLARERTLPVWSSRWALQVRNPNQLQTELFYFTVQPTTPGVLQITTVAPANPSLSLNVQTLTVTGRGFQQGLSVTIFFPDGRRTTGEAIQVTSDTSFTLSFIWSQAGAWAVRINNPNGIQSDLFHFMVLPNTLPDLSIASITPTSPTANNVTQSLTITGQGFQAGLTVKLLLPDGSTTEISGSQIQNVTNATFTLEVILNNQDIESVARSHLEQIPQTRDDYDTRAYWDAGANTVKAVGALPDPVDIFTPPSNEQPTDLAMGYDGVLYIALNTGGIVIQDTKERWPRFTLQPENFTPWRLASDPNGGVWVLDRTRRQIAKVQGLPRPPRAYAPHKGDRFRTCEENPHPPRLTVWTQAVLPSDEEPIAIATNPAGRLAILTWLNGNGRICCLTDTGEFTPPVNLTGARYPYSLTWVANDAIAILLTFLKTEAPVYAIPQLTQGLPEPATSTQPVGDFYPLRNHNGNPFVHGITLPPHYPTTTGSVGLYHLSLPNFALAGEALSIESMDSGSTQTTWHRLYIEALIPPHCGIQIYLAATDSPDPNALKAWHEHQFGELFAPGNGVIPRATWVSSPSEIPYHPGLLLCPQEKNQAGLFTVLIQRPNRRVRSLQGRYLWVRVVLTGDGRNTPEIAALRAYGSRFSYLNQYLPELYRESTFGEEMDLVGSSTPADFLERFLDNFEGILTPLEDRIASAYLLTDPRTTPEDALEWLGSWIGVTFNAAYPPQRRRRMLQAATEIYRRRGTLEGLKMALDVATNNAVSRGEIVILEDFRLRRTFATVLGADLADENDPLLAGITVSGNSYVGDTLILGDETRKEFLALFAKDLPKSAAQEKAIAALFDDLAHRITVFVHQEITPQDLGLIRRVVELETPAHVASRIVTATYPFMVGIASLVSVDTYLGKKPQPQTVTVGRSRVGIRDLIQRPASLDPRLEAGIDPGALEMHLPIAEVGKTKSLFKENRHE